MSYFSRLSDCPPQHYSTIYADPPWMERGAGQIQRGADRHYGLMRTEDIAALPVRQVSAEDAHLYLWVTNNFLRDGFRVVEDWGFRYITITTWAKDRVGIGQYFRGMTEHCLFAVRGRLPYRTRPDGTRAQGRTLLTAARAEHSRKPHEMYEVIESVSHGPRLELFTRNERSGWDGWGSGEPEQRSLPIFNTRGSELCSTAVEQ